MLFLGPILRPRASVFRSIMQHKHTHTSLLPYPRPFLLSVGILSISAIADADSDASDTAAETDPEDTDEELDDSSFDRDYALDITECKWFSSVDFVVENGPRGLLIDETSDKKKASRKRVSLLGGLSTIVDLTTGRPVILRQGRGVLDVNDVQV